MAAPQVPTDPSVDVSKQIGGSAIHAEVWPTAARKGIYD
jgi:hypothetical protein